MLWTYVYMYLFENLLSFLWEIYLAEQLLGHVVILYLIFWKTARMFSTAAEPLYIPTNNVHGFQFLHIFTNTYCVSVN